VTGAELETPDLVIRPFRDDDLDAFAEILTDAVTMRHWPATPDQQAAEQWVVHQQSLYASPGLGRHVLIDKDSGAMVGDAGVLTLELVGRKRNDLGYILDARFHGRGLGTQAAQAMRDHAFASGVTDLWANMAVDHHASQRVAQKIGMHLVTTFRNPRNLNKETLLFGLNADGTAPLRAVT
jgi:[ribosomal protein S5]-alanine N-acetyltransferase